MSIKFIEVGTEAGELLVALGDDGETIIFKMGIVVFSLDKLRIANLNGILNSNEAGRVNILNDICLEVGSVSFDMPREIRMGPESVFMSPEQVLDFLGQFIWRFLYDETQQL